MIDKLDNNGYSESLINDNESDYRRCHNCGRTSGKIDRHEVFFGSNRSNSKKYGMWCDLCRSCHTEVHQGDGSLNQRLKREAQMIFEKNNSRDEFMRIFGRSYL